MRESSRECRRAGGINSTLKRAACPKRHTRVFREGRDENDAFCQDRRVTERSVAFRSLHDSVSFFPSGSSQKKSTFACFNGLAKVARDPKIRPTTPESARYLANVDAISNDSGGPPGSPDGWLFNFAADVSHVGAVRIIDGRRRARRAFVFGVSSFAGTSVDAQHKYTAVVCLLVAKEGIQGTSEPSAPPLRRPPPARQAGGRARQASTGRRAGGLVPPERALRSKHNFSGRDISDVL